jgi:ABC-type polysaccharide transport system permease subunit
VNHPFHITAITTFALLAALVAIIVTACVAIPLAVLLSRELDDTFAKIIEGVSKVVALPFASCS